MQKCCASKKCEEDICLHLNESSSLFLTSTSATMSALQLILLLLAIMFAAAIILAKNFHKLEKSLVLAASSDIKRRFIFYRKDSALSSKTMILDSSKKTQ